MKIIGFVGSPRVGGNTEILVSEVLRGAASAGAEVEQVALNKCHINPCQACDACRALKHCRMGDDMIPLYDKLLEADVLVLGTPIYFWGPSAQFKAFIDRWYALDQEGTRERLQGKRVQLVCAFADREPSTADATVLLMRTGVEWLDMVFCEPLLGASLSDRGDAAKHPDYLAQAYRAGVSLAQPS